MSSPYDEATNQFAVLPNSHGFNSTFGTTLTGGIEYFDAQQFHWHAGSEHTVDDVRMDFEMHTVH